MKRFASFVMALGCFLPWAGSSAAPNLTFQKLHGRWTQTPTGYFLGLEAGSLAINDRWIAAGAQAADEQATNQGAVQLFQATTGAWSRKLLPPSPSPDQRFGSAVLLSGDLVIIGARGSNSSVGRVFVYQATSGKLVRTLAPTASVAGDFFGYALAAHGDVLAVSALTPQQVWLFSLSTGNLLGAPLVPADPNPASEFGTSLAMEGELLLVGAPGADSDRGAGYLFSIANPAAAVQLNKVVPTGAVAGDNTGVTVALHQGRAVLGCTLDEGGVGSVKAVNTRDLANPTPKVLAAQGGTAEFGTQLAASGGMVAAAGSSPGNVQLFQVSNETPFSVITPLDLPAQVGALALNGSSLVVGDPFNDDQAVNNGALYLIQKVTVPLVFETVAAKGNFAAGAENCNFASFGEMSLKGPLAFSSGLIGPGSGGGKDRAIWRDNGSNNLLMKSRTPYLFGLTVASVSSPLLKGYDSTSVPPINEAVIFRAQLSGPGVTSKTNQAVIRTDVLNPDAPETLFRTGTNLPTLNGVGRRPMAFGQLSVPGRVNSVVFAARQMPNAAAPLIDKTNDSALFWYDHGNAGAPLPASLIVISEGEGTPLGTLGELTGHFAFLQQQLLFSAALTSGPASQNQGLFRKTSPAAILTGVATKGLDLVPDSDGNGQAGITFSSFLAESLDSDENGIVRAVIQGTGITKSNNEGLWKVGNAAVGRRLAQKGAPLNGATVKGFKAFWSAKNQGVLWITLAGSGVTAANNEAVVVAQVGAPVDGEPLILLRKGDPAPGFSPARIGALLAVEVDPSGGQYLILASLTGAPPGKNLALFRGHSAATLSTAAHSVLRKPVPVLRKGDLFDNQPAPVKSIVLSPNTRTVGGAGGVGLANVIDLGSNTNSPAKIVFTVNYENGQSRLVRGFP